MKNFFKSLGKFVQNLLDKIKKRRPQKLEKGQLFYADGKPIGTIKDVAVVRQEDVSKEEWNRLMSLCGDGDSWSAQVKNFDMSEELKKIFNIPLTNLPKAYWCKTLLISMAANQPYDYQAVDFSQYEERGLAHYIVGSTKSPAELEAQYQEITGERVEEGDLCWSEDGLCSVIVGGAELLYYEDEGIWEVNCD